MPSNYTHYRFGMENLPQLPQQIRRIIRRFRSLYEAGLHGPDLFFFYSPAVKTKVGDLGQAYHMQTGKAFFEGAARRKPSEGAMAYLFGVLAHYCLDEAFHSVIQRWVEEKKAVHTRVETEFDRYLLELDGRVPAYTQNPVAHLRPTPGELETIAWTYPPATPAQMRRCFSRMRLITSFLATPSKLKRGISRRLVGLAGESGRGLFMEPKADPSCAWAIKPLLGQYRRASQRFPVMAQALYEHLLRGVPLGEDFQEKFG